MAKTIVIEFTPLRQFPIPNRLASFEANHRWSVWSFSVRKVLSGQLASHDPVTAITAEALALAYRINGQVTLWRVRLSSIRLSLVRPLVRLASVRRSSKVVCAG